MNNVSTVFGVQSVSKIALYFLITLSITKHKMNEVRLQGVYIVFTYSCEHYFLSTPGIENLSSAPKWMEVEVRVRESACEQTDNLEWWFGMELRVG